ncbi:alpha/beta hydrolase [Nonomuraea sp. NPDC050663]|uniref:alpha/beta hydrolase n=1 Tax=Nonomuraea sp. NPDC050663 TaxID=3364370 RepID=UPI0037A7C1DA
MRIPRSICAPLTALSVAVAAAVAIPSPALAAVVKVENTVEVRCAFLTYRQSSDWYLPTGAPKGLVWLQHGFSRSNDHLDDLGRAYAGAGFLVFAPTLPSADLFGCTVNNTGNNTDFLHNVADLFGKAADPGDKLGRSFADARAKAGRPGLGLPAKFVFAGHSAGGEAVSHVAQELRSGYPAAWPRLAGLVLLDPVKSPAGDNLGRALGHLDGTPLPIQAISSPPYLCNSDASGTAELAARLHRPFLGVRLSTGAHTDAEGASADAIGRLTCGSPQAQNVAALQALATTWAAGYVSGSPDPAWYPGGASYEGLRGAGVIQTL